MPENPPTSFSICLDGEIVGEIGVHVKDDVWQ
jgi:hypothetical protein